MRERRLTIAMAAVALAAWTIDVPAQRPAPNQRWVATWGTAPQLVRLPTDATTGRGQPPAPAATPNAPALAHQHDVKVIGCTITPYGGSSTYTAQGEALREAVNTWIGTSGAFDAVIDFDAATPGQDRSPPVPRRSRFARSAAPGRWRLSLDGRRRRSWNLHEDDSATLAHGRRCERDFTAAIRS